MKVSPEWLREMTDLVGLAIDDERLAAMAPQFEEFMLGVRQLEEVDLGETEPAMLFPISERE